MSAKTKAYPATAPAAGGNSMDSALRRATVTALVGALVALGGFPGVAQAHGPVAPIATSYLARVDRVPAGLDAKVVDGDLRMWLRAAPSTTVVVLDYRGAPYLRFSRFGVDLNHNSSMYYLNQSPAETPPSNLTATTPTNWRQVSSGHAYGWHDGRLHALATVALAPGVSYVGRWSVPVGIDGHLSAIAGGLWHADDPSIVWFWPIVVLLACVLAARRVHRPALDRAIARVLAVVALSGVAVAGVGRELHGRPTVSVGQLLLLAVILAFVGWGLCRVLLQRPGYFSYFLISFAALWAGGELVPTLLDGFVLMAVPAFVARAAAVLCLGCGAGVLLLVFRLAGQPQEASSVRRTAHVEREDDGTWEYQA
jgi:hypothetical protein